MIDKPPAAPGHDQPATNRRMNVWAAVSVALICFTVAYLTHHARESQRTRPVQRLWKPIVVTPEGNATTLPPATRRLEFWTPSAHTKDFLAGEDGAIRPRDRWEALLSDEPVKLFGLILRTNSHVLGYRRAEVWGHGRTLLKPGWWWTMTVTTNYSVQSLTRTYRDFWKSTNTLFVEMIENPGEE